MSLGILFCANRKLEWKHKINKLISRSSSFLPCDKLTDGTGHSVCVHYLLPLALFTFFLSVAFFSFEYWCFCSWDKAKNSVLQSLLNICHAWQKTLLSTLAPSLKNCCSIYCFGGGKRSQKGQEHMKIISLAEVGFSGRMQTVHTCAWDTVEVVLNKQEVNSLRGILYLGWASWKCVWEKSCIINNIMF